MLEIRSTNIFYPRQKKCNFAHLYPLSLHLNLTKTNKKSTIHEDKFSWNQSPVNKWNPRTVHSAQFTVEQQAKHLSLCITKATIQPATYQTTTIYESEIELPLKLQIGSLPNACSVVLIEQEKKEERKNLSNRSYKWNHNVTPK